MAAAELLLKSLSLLWRRRAVLELILGRSVLAIERIGKLVDQPDLLDRNPHHLNCRRGDTADVEKSKGLDGRHRGHHVLVLLDAADHLLVIRETPPAIRS